MFRSVWIAAGVMLVVSATAHAKKPKKEPSGPIVGWHREASWTADCWYPPDFSTMAEGVKRMAWQESRDAIVGQWRGDRNDGVQLNDNHVENLETILLSKAERIESVAKDNLAQCQAAVAVGGSNSAWDSWLVAVAGKLTEGECPYPPLDYTAFNYLSVNSDWQNALYACRGDKVVVHGTDGDYFQLQQGGPWINVAGDPAAPLAPSLPCNTEGCVRGQLVMRFTSDSGSTQVIPIGISTEFLVPDHGRIEVMINDDSLADNKFKVEKGLEHHTGIEVKPAGK
ncbi:MAG: hypothetical protein ABMA64_29510 [Myxococcota bacterium]